MEKSVIEQCPHCLEGFETTIQWSRLLGTDSSDRWYPNDIKFLTNYIEKYSSSIQGTRDYDSIVSNIAYNLQYLEYLLLTLRELNLSSVLRTQTIKYFIVAGAAVIEAILFLVCSKNQLNLTKWEKGSLCISNEVDYEGTKIKIETIIWRRLQTAKTEEMNFDRMIKMVSKRKIIEVDADFFVKLNGIRKLRNRIHIQVIDGGLTDYLRFYQAELELVKLKLFQLLTCNLFRPVSSEIEKFSYLNEV